MINSYKDLIVWQKSVDLTIKIYELTKKFPREEQFGIVSQLRRAIISIPANIAEGFCRFHRKEYKQFLLIAFGSAAEVETFLIISERIGYIPKEEFYL